MTSDRKPTPELAGKRQLTINFYRELQYKEHISTKDPDSLLAERWWGIGGKDNPLSEFNIREAIASAKMSEEESKLRDELSQKKAKQIQDELLAELNIYIDKDKKSDYPGLKTVKKLFARSPTGETETADTKQETGVRELFWPWQHDSVQMYNQAKEFILSIKNYDTAYVAFMNINALINPQKSRRLSQRLMKVNEKLHKHIDDLSRLVLREFAAWVHKQIINHYAKVYDSMNIFFQAYVKFEPIEVSYPILCELSYFDTKTGKMHDVFNILIPWDKKDVAFIASLAQRMRLEAPQVIRDILQNCRMAAGLAYAPELAAVVPVSLAPTMAPPLPMKKSELPSEIEGVFNSNPVTVMDESALAQPVAIEDNEDQPGLPLSLKLAVSQRAAFFQPAEEVEGLDEAEGRPEGNNKAKFQIRNQ
ncbi:MAG: hypothetical protein ACYCQI_12140 [Gammaproteobacteria bacterium]